MPCTNNECTLKDALIRKRMSEIFKLENEALLNEALVHELVEKLKSAEETIRNLENENAALRLENDQEAGASGEVAELQEQLALSEARLEGALMLADRLRPEGPRAKKRRLDQ